MEVLQVAVDYPEIKFTYPRSRGPTSPKSEKFCHFHNDYGHNTNDCFHLRDEIERLVQAGQSPQGKKGKISRKSVMKKERLILFILKIRNNLPKREE
ncbi:hypothetical protein ACS0TY_018526 [Phlomoides rotata]